MVELIILIIATLAISFICSLLESTLLSVPISYLTMKEDEGNKAAIRFLAFKEDIDKPLSAILIINTVANTLGATLIGAKAAELAPNNKILVGCISGFMTFAILVFAEILPKSLGTNYGKRIIGVAGSLIQCFIIIAYPFVLAAQWFTSLVAPKEEEAIASRDEISALISAAEEDGVFEEDEEQIIQNVINMDDTKAYDIMTPRIVCSVAEENMTLRQFYKDESLKHHSRIPVYSGERENITGYVLKSDALELLVDDKFDTRLREIRRPITFFNEETSIDDIWEALLAKREQICLVTDEYGSFEGIITLEDIIETIFGLEIIDELDEASDMQELARQKWEKRKKKYAIKNANKTVQGAQKQEE